MIADNYLGLNIIKITDPSNPTLEASLATDGGVNGVSIFEKDANLYAVLADHN